MTVYDPSAVANAWERCSLPLSIAAWLRTLDPAPPPAPVVNLGPEPEPRANVWFERALRFVRFADGSSEQQDALQKAWGAVCRARRTNSGDGDTELAVFMQLPDREEYNPHALLYGGRRLDRTAVAQERKRYNQLRMHVAAVRIALMNGPLPDRRKPLADLLQDAGASGASQVASTFRRDHLDSVIRGLRALDDLLIRIDPAHKVPTAQPFADGAAQMVFVNQVAALNRHLVRPQHAKLVILATVNCPSAVLNAAQVGKAWSRMDKHR